MQSASNPEVLKIEVFHGTMFAKITDFSFYLTEKIN